MKNGTYIVIAEEDGNGDIILPLPKELLEGDDPWLENDDIRIELTEKGAIMINLTWIARKETEKLIG
jgi:hypothetical protein